MLRILPVSSGSCSKTEVFEQLYYKLYDRLREADLLSKESPKDIIELAKSIYQVRIHGAWNRSEIAQRIGKLFKKLGIDSLT
jgi:hypothetical protein